MKNFDFIFEFEIFANSEHFEAFWDTAGLQKSQRYFKNIKPANGQSPKA
jgi:hypothetical protein